VKLEIWDGEKSGDPDLPKNKNGEKREIRRNEQRKPDE